MSGGSRVYDPSKLHLKREFTQIRKAGRVLRDPGTTSSWKSPLSSSRSVFITNDHDHHHHFSHSNNNNNNNNVAINVGNNNANANDNKVKEIDKDKDKDKERRVFLYNWRSNKSASEKSLVRVELDDDNDNEESSASASVESDSKNDTCVIDHRSRRHYSTALGCRDTRLASTASPPMMVRRAVGKKKKSRRASSSVILKQQLQKQTQRKSQRVVVNRNSKWGLPTNGGAPSGSLVLSQDDSVSLIDQSDYYEEHCGSEDLHRGGSVESLFLSRLMLKNKFLRGSWRESSSYTLSTPALSNSSYNRFLLRNCKNPSTVGSWNGTSGASCNDMNDNDDGEDHLDFPGRQGCGIPCYWSKRTPKHNKGSCGSCYSPSLSDTLRRTGGRLICGSQKDRHKSLSRARKQKILSQMAQGRLPLLTNNSCDGDGGDSSLGTGNTDDELSTNFGELHLEGASRLDGRRWSASCRSQEGSELMAVGGSGEEEGSLESIRSLSWRYRPIFFDELIGQNIVVHSLMNSVSRGKVAPVYLFQGPRGTGKTSTAKIFAAAMNCLVSEGSKPCGICRECTEYISGKSKDLIEVDGANKKVVNRVRYLLKSLSISPSAAFSRYKILLIEECHLLPSKAWLAFLKFLEEPPHRVVFIFVTTDLDNVPRTVLSRCQKYMFNMIKDSDIVERLRKIVAEENLDVDPEALHLIALNADGSLREAETMLDQLSLLGKKITPTLVNELVGVVPDEKLLELLELAMSSNTSETVKRARELMDTGVDPLVLMSQMASLIMDIIAGSCQLEDVKSRNSCSDEQLLDTELERLKHALKLLSEAETQLRASSERSTWFTATLLQLGYVTSPVFTLSGSSKKHSSKTTEDDPSIASRDASGHKKTSDPFSSIRRSASPPSLAADGNRKASRFNSKALHNRSASSVNTGSHGDIVGGNVNIGKANLDRLDDIWLQCIERCHSKTLRQLLHTHGKLLSIGEAHGVLIVYIAFEDGNVKNRVERFLISITNSIEIVLRRSVQVRVILLPHGLECLGTEQNPDSHHRNGSESKLNLNGGSNSSLLLDERAGTIFNPPNPTTTQEGIPMQRIESIIREQRLETAWLQQAAEKSTSSSLSRLRPEKNQILPQDSLSFAQTQVEIGSPNHMDLPSNHWDDNELNHGIKALKVNNGKNLRKDISDNRIGHVPMSPSLLHQSGFAANLSKDYQESGSGKSVCNMLLCWNTSRRRNGKVNQGNPVRARKDGGFLCFGMGRKPRQTRPER